MYALSTTRHWTDSPKPTTEHLDRGDQERCRYTLQRQLDQYRRPGQHYWAIVDESPDHAVVTYQDQDTPGRIGLFLFVVCPARLIDAR